MVKSDQTRQHCLNELILARPRRYFYAGQRRSGFTVRIIFVHVESLQAHEEIGAASIGKWYNIRSKCLNSG